MATKAELLEQAKAKGLDVKTSDTKAELESKLASSTNGADESVTVNENEDGEATHGTTKEGDESPVKNGEEVPQSDVREIETSNNPGANTSGDEARTEREIRFADEANPNNKARPEGAAEAEFDQDGNPRTGGKSYGVAANNPETNQDVFLSNRGEAPEGQELVNEGEYFNPVAGSDQDTNNREWSVEDQRSLEETLSEPENNIKAVVSTSAGSYVRVKFLRNNLAFGTFRSRAFTEEKAKQYLADLKESRGL